MMNKNPSVSVLITTYNRSRILPRALDSVLKQDYEDFEIVIVDDHSVDDTEKTVEWYMNDPRIRYIRNEKNIGSRYGDRAIFREFVQRYARGKFFIYLCDDDYWIPSNLLSRLVALMEMHPSLSQAIGAQTQIYPHTLYELPEINSFWHYEWVPGIENAMYMKNLYPEGFIKSDDFLKLFAVDPIMRNILTGSTLFRRSCFEKAKILDNLRGSKWQAGYELTLGASIAGDVYYINEPCVASLVDIESASFRGTQRKHMADCLKSVGIAFENARAFAIGDRSKTLKEIERKVKHGIIINYIINKISYRLGWFGWGLAGIENIFKPEISFFTFLYHVIKNGIPLSDNNKILLYYTLIPRRYLPRFANQLVKIYGLKEWVGMMRKYPDNSEEL